MGKQDLNRVKHNKSLNATPKLCMRLSPESTELRWPIADWARVNSMLHGLRFWLFLSKPIYLSRIAD